MSQRRPLRVSLLGFLESLMRNLKGYRTLISELLQNTDDAPGSGPGDSGPTEMEFLVAPDALHVRNNGSFRALDFDRLAEIASGGKRWEENTTGAFGIGFTAVYQITDSPEIVSAGRHWIFHPEDGEIEERAAAGEPGTHFRFPWAMNPDTRIRQELRLEVLTAEAPEEFRRELAEVLPLAVLFLKKVDTVRYGSSDGSADKVTRVRDETRDQVLVQNGGLRLWQLLRGRFVEEAVRLRAEYPGKIEDKRGCEVVLAVPLEDEQAPPQEWEGTFFATLPTQQSTRLPFHLQADFFPASDRKNLLWEEDFQGEWNRAAVAAAADVLADNLGRLPDLLRRPARVCGFLQQLQEVHRLAARRPSPGCLPVLGEFWERAEPVARCCPLVLTSNQGWRDPGAVTLLAEGDEPFRPVAEQLGIAVAVGEVRSYQNLLTGLGARVLLPQRLADALTAVTPDPVAEQAAPEWLRSPGPYALLADEIRRLLDRHRQQNASASAAFAGCVLARGTDGWFHPPGNLLLADSATARLFNPINLSCPFLAPDSPEVLAQLVPAFDPARAVAELAKLPAEELAGHWADRPETIRGVIAWFADRPDRLRTDKGLRNRLASLPLWPSSSGLHPLGELVMPGGFRDDLQLAQMVDDCLVQDVGDFLRHVMEVPVLTVRDYVTVHVPEAFRRGVPSDKVRKLVGLLAERLGEFRGHPDVRRVLSSCPLVECTDGEFRPPEAVYFAEAGAGVLLGRAVPVARIPPERRDAVTVLLDWLGVARLPRVQDVIRRVDDLCGQPPTPLARGAVQQVLAHLIDRWPGDAITSWRPLQDRAWLPAQGDEAGWHLPYRLYATYSRHLFFRSEARFLDLDNSLQNQRAGRDVLSYLGVQTQEPPVGLVVTHLLACAAVRDGVNQQVYEFLNRHARAAEVGRLRDRPCLREADGAYADPRTVFRRDPELGRFARVLTGDAVGCLDLLERLEVAEIPGPEDALRVLGAMEAEFGAANRPLADPQDQQVLWYCWKLLGEAEDQVLGALRERKCVLNDQNQLRPPEALLVNDRPALAPKFAHYLQHNLIPRREETWRVLHRAGVRLLSQVLESHLLSPQNPRPAVAFKARLWDRRTALGRVLEDLPPDDRGHRPLDRLLQLDVVEADALRVQQVLRWPRPITLDSESVPAHPDPEARRVYLVPPGDARYWPLVSRALLTAMAPEGDVGGLAASVMSVLAAESAAAAHSLLDALGLAPLDVEGVTGVSSGTPSEIPAGDAFLRREEESPVPVAPPAPVGDRPDPLPAPRGDAPGRDPHPDRDRPAGGQPRPDALAGPHHPDRPGGSSEPLGPTGSLGTRPPTGDRPGQSEVEDEEIEVEEIEDWNDAEPDHNGRRGRDGDGRNPGRSRSGDRPERQARPVAPEQQTRLTSYVIHRAATDSTVSDSAPLAEDDWHGIGHQGVERVANEERHLHPDWDVRVMPPNHPGYDIEVHRDGVLIRFIEVKSLRDRWGNRGVGMTPVQFELALREGDRYWLYVVERVEGPDAPITRIPNPARRVTRFQFDAGWRAAGVALDGPETAPEPL